VDRIEGLEQVSIGGRVMRYLDDGLGGGDLASISLVPAFDEWVLGYQDRSLIASDAAMRLVATVNGIFRPAVLKDGVVIGIWREPSTSRRSAEVDYLGDPGVRVRKAVDRAIEEWRSTLVE
jgi:hypothetical protein